MNHDRKPTRKSWSAEEDAQLLQLIKKHGTSGCWPKIALSMDSRSGKQCRERYMNHLDPHMKKSAWTPEEDHIIKDLFPKLGTRWSLYMPSIPGRSDNSIKNRYHVIRKNNFECCRGDASTSHTTVPNRKRTHSETSSEDTDADTIDGAFSVRISSGSRRGSVQRSSDETGDEAPTAYVSESSETNPTLIDQVCSLKDMSVSSSKLTRRPWNEQEDTALLKLIEKFGCIGCWPNIARLMKSRTGKQCRERYINHLDPNTKKSPWTLQEDDIIRELYPTLNTRWSQYMSRLPGRTDNAIKNRYHAITRRNFNYYDGSRSDCSASVVSTGDKRSMAETVVEGYTDEAGDEPQAKRARVLQSASAVRSVPVRALRTLSSVSDLTTNQTESETTSSFSMDDFDFDKIAVEVAVIEREEEVLKKNISGTDLDFDELLNSTFDLSCYNLAF